MASPGSVVYTDGDPPAFNTNDGRGNIRRYLDWEINRQAIVETAPNEAMTPTDAPNDVLMALHGAAFARLKRRRDFTETIMDDRSHTITKPTGSGLSHRCMNPYLYADMKEFTLPLLADILGCPKKTWKRTCSNVVKNQQVLRSFYRFRDLPEGTPEAEVSAAFALMADDIASFVHADVEDKPERHAIIGGHMVESKYNAISKTDHIYVSGEPGQNRPVMAVEVKSTDAFHEGSYWYRGNHAQQVYSALYSTNSPTFLISQKKWKIFFENAARDTVYTQVGSGGRSVRHNCTLIANIDSDFIKAIALCFIGSKVARLPVTKKKLTAPVTTKTELSQKPLTAEKDASKNNKRSLAETITPTFLDMDGCRRTVRVYGEDEVAEILFSIAETRPGTAE